jgi:DNA mismatch repair protein MutS2
MTLREGSIVKVKSLKQIGTIVSIDRGRARVVIGSLTINCKIEDLVLSDEAPRKLTSKNNVELPQYEAKQIKSLESIDLHGLTVADALAALEKHLNSAIMARMDRIDVVHGIGSGRVKDAVHQYLNSLSVVRKIEINQFNVGITRVFL